jgi:uncharacterized membrane protein HdeD (DUF308 family)
MVQPWTERFAHVVIPQLATLTMTLFIGWILVYAGVVMAIHVFER